MAKVSLKPSNQFPQVTDEKLRGYFISVADEVNETARKEIINIYTDPLLASYYRGFRNFNDMNRKGYTDKKTMREIVRIPAGHVYEFLKSLFEPVYGKEWLTKRKVLRHELIRPFWIVSKI